MLVFGLILETHQYVHREKDAIKNQIQDLYKKVDDKKFANLLKFYKTVIIVQRHYW